MLSQISWIIVSLLVPFGGASLAVGIALAVILAVENCGVRIRWNMDSWLVGMLFIPTFVSAGAWTAGFGLQGWWPSFLPGFSPVSVAGKPILGMMVVIWIYAVVLFPLAFFFLRLGFRSTNQSAWILAQMEGGFWIGLRRGFWPMAASWIKVAVGVLAGLISTDMFVTNLFQVNTLTERSYQDMISGQSPVTTILSSSLLSWTFIFLLGGQRVFEPTRDSPATVVQVPQAASMRKSFATRWISFILLLSIVGTLTIVPWTNLLLRAGWAATESAPTGEVTLPSSNESGNPQQTNQRTYGWSLSQTIQSVAESPARFAKEFYWSASLGFAASLMAILIGIPTAVLLQWGPSITRKLVIFLLAALFFLPGPAVNQAVLIMMQQDFIVWWNDNTLLAPILCLQFRLIPIVVAWSVWFMLNWLHRYRSTWTIDFSLPSRAKLQILLLPVGWSVLRLWLILTLVSFSDLSTYILCLPPGVTTISMRVFELLHYGVRFQEAGLLLFIAVLGLGFGFLFGNLNSSRKEDAWL